ncbi:MAG: hypothetical protein ACJ73D_00095 [Pyrinomonadaceae bacterium]
MKLVIGIIMLATLGVGASAQQVERAKVLAEVAASGQAVKGQPFSADSVSESVQTLADGNRIVQTSSGKIYRNSDGKIRREMTGGNGGHNTFFFNYGPGISIAEPAGGYRVLLNEKERTARAVTVVPDTEVKVFTRTPDGAAAGEGPNSVRVFTRTEGPLTDEQKRALETLKGHKEGDQLTPEQKKAMEVLRSAGVLLRAEGAMMAAPLPPLPAIAAPRAMGMGGDNWFVGGAGDSKWETKTEDLGTQNIEGVICEGTRHVTTIPAGGIGNERPIEITYERWFSKDLGMVVMSKHSDPRFGEQTYTLKNIVRAEPDPSLFTVPKNFQFQGEPGGVYKVRTGEGEREVTRARAATPPAAPKQP